MNILRVTAVLSFTCAVALVGCGGGSGSKSDGGGGSSGGGTRTGGMCPPSTSTCTTAESNTYVSCIETACRTEFTTCFGAGYLSGTFSGACGTYLQCTSKCACGDTTCESACTMDAACTACEQSISTCFFGAACTIPACYLGGTGMGGTSGTGTGGTTGGGMGGTTGGGTTGCAGFLACCNRASATLMPSCTQLYTQILPMGDAICTAELAALGPTLCPAPGTTGGTCADLLACCNKASAPLKPSCMQIYTAVKPSGDATCGAELAGLKSSLCP